MIIKTLVIIMCLVLPAQAMEFGFGGAGNVGMGFSRWEIDVVDPLANHVTDHLSSREPVFGSGPMVNFWFNDNFGLNIGFQYSWFNYNYTYDYATSSEAYEWRESFQNLILPSNLIIAIPFGKNRAFIGGGILVFKQLNGKLSITAWGDDMVVQNISNENLETGVLPRVLIGAEFCSGNISYQTTFDYYHGLDGLFTGPGISTHHLSLTVAVLYYPGKKKE